MVPLSALVACIASFIQSGSFLPSCKKKRKKIFRAVSSHVGAPSAPDSAVVPEPGLPKKHCAVAPEPTSATSERKKSFMGRQKNKLRRLSTTATAAILASEGSARADALLSLHTVVGTTWNALGSCIKLGLNYLQVLGSLEDVYDVMWPEEFGHVVRFISKFAQLDFISMVPFACMGDFDYYTKFTSTMGIVVSFNLLFAVGLLTVRSRRPITKKNSAICARLVYVWIGFNFISYMSVCSTLFRALPCEMFDDGSSLLIADFSIDCDSRRYRVFQCAAVAGTVLYVVGLPVTFLCLLVTYKPKDDVAKHELDPLMFLRHSYRSDRSFTEPFVLLQKISIAGVLVFFSRGSYTQIVLGIIISIIWAIGFAGRSIRREIFCSTC